MTRAICVAALWLATAHLGSAPSPSTAEAAAQSDAAAAAEVSLGARLRCPVCQGMPIGESPAPMAQDMMRQVRARLAEGDTEAEIVAYFTERYGAWVLLDPPKEGIGLWVWLLPPAFLAAAIAWALALARRGTRAGDRGGAGAAGGTDAEAQGAREDAATAALRAAVRQAVRQ